MPSWKISLLLLPTLLLAAAGCYSGHAIKKADLSKIHSGASEKVVKLKALEGEDLVVAEDTGVEVIDVDGLSYRLQPFTFKVTTTQLVAPEQDLVLPLGTIDRVEVRQLNTLGTVALFSAGVVAGAAIVVGIALSAGEDTGF